MADKECNKTVNPLKAIFFVSEVIQKNVFKRRGIACAVYIKKKRWLVTSSSALEEKDNQNKPEFIAERFSRRHFGHYRLLEVSIFKTLGNFTFLKIGKKSSGGKLGRSWLTILNLESPSSAKKESENQFFGTQQDVKLEFKRDGNSTNTEVITEKPAELTSILGAPIINEDKKMKKTQSGRFSFIGVVGLTSDSVKKLCPGYLDKDENALGKFCLVCTRIHRLVGLIFSYRKILPVGYATVLMAVKMSLKNPSSHEARTHDRE